MNVSRRNIGHIHRVREFELEKVSLADEFDILQIVGEGWFGKILLVEHRGSDTEMVLKALPKPYVSLRDFYREFHYGLHLGVHRNIVTTYDVAFETAGFYVFTQEYAPLGDLTSNVSDSGIGELHTKKVAKQIASALDFIHSKDIVHRDVKLDNVLVFKSDFSRVKLCDFGESRRFNTNVQRRNEWLAYSPPEVLAVPTDANYRTDPSHDIWQFAIVTFVCLTGCLPWQRAANDDPRYVRYSQWQQSSLTFPIKRQPKLFKLVSSRGCKMFKKFLEPRPLRRPRNFQELNKFMDDRWLAKGAEKDMAENEPDELCPSMYSFHSSPEEKNKLLYELAQAGIETTVDRVAKKTRIRDWIEASVIAEEDEEDDSSSTTPSSSVSRAPVAGHISSIRAEEQKAIINTTIKDASRKHIDPRTGQIQLGPSEMVQPVPEVDTTRSNSSADSGGANGQDQEVINQNRKPFLDKDKPIQTMINAKMEFPVHKGNGNDNGIRYYNEAYDYSSQSVAESMNKANGQLKDKNSTFFNPFKKAPSTTAPPMTKNVNPRKIDSGYGSAEKMPSNKMLNVPGMEIKTNSDSGSLDNNNSLSSKDHSPFDDSDSPRGSIGFVNFAGGSSRKDTPYDIVKPVKK